jgi:hypothetical protein
VLEKLEDYIKHNIVPSKKRIKIFKLFNEFKKLKGEHSEKVKYKVNLDNVKSKWQVIINNLKIIGTC